jgi:hypothetical protein
MNERVAIAQVLVNVHNQVERILEAGIMKKCHVVDQGANS